jgi:plasmid stabilization system protein ParE
VRRTYEVRYLPAAEQDLLDILDYIARDDPSAARAFVDGIERAIARLTRRAPTLGTRVYAAAVTGCS